MGRLPEPIQNDGTILHAIERILPIIVETQGLDIVKLTFQEVIGKIKLNFDKND